MNVQRIIIIENTYTYRFKLSRGVFTQGDLLVRVGVSEDVLSGWLKAKLVRPAGFAEDKTPLFTADAVDLILHIRKLENLGYRTEEIQKIIKKFGLPEGKTDKFKPAKKEPYLTVGSLADRSGVSPRTIKHWEDKGIIDPDMRTEGGFRLYSDSYVFLCQLIRDLQLFGYTLEEIKTLSDEVRDFLAIRSDLDVFPKGAVDARLAAMLKRILELDTKMKLLKEGIARWEDLLKKTKKDIQGLRNKNQKRREPGQAPGKEIPTPKIVFIEPQAPNLHIFSQFPLPRLGALILGTMMKARGWEVEIYVEDIRKIDFEDVGSADLVGISTITSTAPRAYAIADRSPRHGNSRPHGRPPRDLSGRRSPGARRLCHSRRRRKGPRGLH